MKKGFIFTLDSAMALMVVIIVALMFTTYFQADNAKENVFQPVLRDARDKATVGFYLGKDAAGMGLSATMPLTDSAACATIYDNSPSQTATPEKAYCKGI